MKFYSKSNKEHYIEIVESKWLKAILVKIVKNGKVLSIALDKKTCIELGQHAKELGK